MCKSPDHSKVVGALAYYLTNAEGLGIGTPEQASEVAQVADGVIIGSKLVRLIADSGDLSGGLDAITGFLGDTRAALAGKASRPVR